mgnify:CR=1 FL=1
MARVSTTRVPLAPMNPFERKIVHDAVGDEANVRTFPVAIGADVSRAGDLGYTHGTYDLTDSNKKVIERGSYVRIWKRQGGRWQVVLDITNAH